jgi:hypothetical protein
VAGLAARPSLEAHFRARPRAAHRETAAALRAAGDGGLADLVASLRAERAQAAEEEAWRAADAAATVRGPDGIVPLAAAEAALPAERDRGRRQALSRAVAEGLALPAREAAAETRARARAEVGLVPRWKRVVEGDALLAASDDVYAEVLAYTVRDLGLAPAPRGDLQRGDLLHALALGPWQGLFPRRALAEVLDRTARALTLHLETVRVDDGARAAQWPGAHAFEARVALRRQGGAPDWLGLLDAVGQALAAAAAPPHRRHPAAPFTIGALLAGLLLDRGFLARELEVDRRHAGDVVRALALRELFRLRAAAAALRVASEVERGTAGAAWAEAHREALTRAALAAWPAGLHARDADAGRAEALLAGAARAAVLRRRLVERHDEDWWRNPRSAETLGSWLAQGGAWADEEPALADGAAWLAAAM